MAPLVHALREARDEFSIQVCVTGQHRQMLDQVLEIFKITPEIDLDLMKPGQDLVSLNAAVLLSVRDMLLTHQPDVVLVHGDTTTTLATAMASFYVGIPVGHVEAGLRTFNLKSPYPEEFNRQVVSRIASWHFAPTELCKTNLLTERVLEESITVTGNTVIDSLHWMLDHLNGNLQLQERISSDLNRQLPFMWKDSRFILITGHRRENFGEGFMEICLALGELAQRFPTTHFVYPVHLNPMVQTPVKSILANFSNIHLIEPQDYQQFIYLMKHCYFVLTDSGGIQEEAPSLGKPVLLMRDTTERSEAVEGGTVELVGANRKKIVAAVTRLLEDRVYYDKMANAHNPYGDGKAVERILRVLRGI